MRKEILDALKAKFPGVSDAILGRIADKLAKTATTKEEVTTAVEGVTFQQVLESYGDSRATEAQHTAVTNYEKKHGLKDGKKLEQEGEPGGKGEQPKPQEKPGEETVPAWAQAILDSNKALNEEIAKMKGEKVASNRKSKLNTILEGAPEEFRQRYEKDFARMSFKDDEDFDGWIGDITPDVEKIKNDYQAKGGVVGRPKGGAAGGGTGTKEVNPHLKARIAEREAETTVPAIIGLQTTSK